MKILFASAELRPLVSAGGLGEAAAGLTAALRDAGHDLTTALPAYEPWTLGDERVVELDVPEWAGPAIARVGNHPDAGRLALIEVPGIERPDPYVDVAGEGWQDNDVRFARFARAVASLAAVEAPDVVHLNDWHTALTPAFLDDRVPTVLTIHNLQHQGWTDLSWLHHLPRLGESYQRGDAVNMLAGGLRSVDRIVAVSPNYAAEILSEENGFELDDVLRDRQDDLVGIINGIDTRRWDPAVDPLLPTAFDATSLDAKAASREALLDHVGWDDTGEPIVAMITRLVDQKGVDLALQAAEWLPGVRARLVVLGSGAVELADQARAVAEENPERVWFYDGYDVPLSHLMFGGSDFLLMPSRFEPCGLAQMQAMAYGTIPIVTPVGGLIDTVLDDDLHAAGNGFVSSGVDVTSLVDAMHRGARAWRHAGRRKAIQRRGMRADWSWSEPGEQFVDVYRQAIAARAGD